MPTKTSPNAFASALSLLAITVGAVSAALIVMCIGMYVTIISVDTSAKVNVQAAAAVQMPRPFVVALSGDQIVGEEVMSPHLSDALFREGAEMAVEESDEVPAVNHVPLPRTYLATARMVSCTAHCRPAKRVNA
jgi:hypothetical protein